MIIIKAVDALIELAIQKPIEHGWNQALRQDRVLSILDKINLKPGEIDPDFDAVYAHTLVEWGAVKRAEEIRFFRHEEVQKAFRRSFDDIDDADFSWETEGIVELLASQGGRFHADPRSQLKEFAAIFHRLARATRTPSEVLRDQSIVRLHAEISTLQVELQELRQEQKDLEIVDLLNRFIAAPPEEEDLEALRPYLEWVQRRSQRLAFSALDPAQKDSDQVKLGDVFINLDAAEKEVPWPDDPQQFGVLTAALGHIYNNEQIVLKGDPGSGKSTLLHFLAYCLAGDWLDGETSYLERLQWAVEQQPAERSVEPRSFLRAGEDETHETRTQHWQGSHIPILIELRNFVHQSFEPGDTHAFWRYFKRYLEEDVFDAEMARELRATCDALYHRAARGEVIWLLDGIDEVPLEQRRAVWQAVSALESGTLGGGRWVATSRILSFDEALLPKRGIAVQTLRPMSLKQIDQFVDDWFHALRQKGELTVSEADTYAGRLRYAVQHRGEDFFKMAANPMLLTIMALVQTYFRGILPEQRARLYKACVDTLLWRWQRRKEGTSEEALPAVLAELGVDYGELERLLWEIGWKAHEGARSRAETADISREEVLTIAQRNLGSLAKAAAFIEYTEQRAHILIGRGGQEMDMYTFPHRTLQEFLAACHLTKQRKMGRKMRELCAEGDMWREVLNLAVGTLVFNNNDIVPALDAIAELVQQNVPAWDDENGWRRVWMAGELCAIVGQEAAQKDEEGALLLPLLRRQLSALLAAGVLKAAERHEAANALAQLGDDRKGVGFIIRDRLKIPDIAWGGEVPAGAYTIGGDESAWRSLEEMTVPIDRSYHLARYPVTVAQFDCFAGAEDVDKADWWAGMPDDQKYAAGIRPSRWLNANRPRETVTWYQAVAFCRWLDHHLKLAGLIAEEDEIDLPREFEWEAAARYAGDGQTDKRSYPWGGERITPEHANYDATGLGETSAVGLFPAGRQPELDLDDLSGNVWEWCRSKYKNPEETAVDDSGDSRALRGGSWYDDQEFARAAYRSYDYPHYRYDSLRFSAGASSPISSRSLISGRRASGSEARLARSAIAAIFLAARRPFLRYHWPQVQETAPGATWRLARRVLEQQSRERARGVPQQQQSA